METHAQFTVGGERVVGVLHLPDTPAPAAGHPLVVMLHGYTGHKSETHRLFTLTARHLARLGVGALRFDFRGSGDSDGDFSAMTVSREVEDALAGVEYARARPGVDPARVMLMGFSMGGMVAALAAP
ncbi:alpha/beta hydrolase, partial [Deinococcus pimensis]|uniref:alpha/beta hydrolase n=1 Tax=Deinococcus pimensis TaxID=309888 RepID=UPI00047F6E0D